MPTSTSYTGVRELTRAEALEFLQAEAHLLNSCCYDDWLALLTDDFDYRIINVLKQDDPFRPVEDESNLLAWESKNSLRIRFLRMKSEFAWADRPLGFQRRHVTAARVLQPTEPNMSAYDTVESDVMVFRSRVPDTPSVVSALRRDLLETTDSGYRLKRRHVYLDLDDVDATHLAVIY